MNIYCYLLQRGGQKAASCFFCHSDDQRPSDSHELNMTALLGQNQGFQYRAAQAGSRFCLLQRSTPSSVLVVIMVLIAEPLYNDNASFNGFGRLIFSNCSDSDSPGSDQYERIKDYLLLLLLVVVVLI